MEIGRDQGRKLFTIHSHAQTIINKWKRPRLVQNSIPHSSHVNQYDQTKPAMRCPGVRSYFEPSHEGYFYWWIGILIETCQNADRPIMRTWVGQGGSFVPRRSCVSVRRNKLHITRRYDREFQGEVKIQAQKWRDYSQSPEHLTYAMTR